MLIKCVRKMTAYQLKALLCWASSLAICAYLAHLLSDICILHRRVKWTNHIAPRGGLL